MKKDKYFPPKYATGHFHCPHCDVYAKQFWAHIIARRHWGGTFIGDKVSDFNEILAAYWTISKCDQCGEIIFWRNDTIVYPKKINAELPNNDLLDDIKKDYLEAAAIFNESPRASAALLRLALQKLCKQSGEKGANINNDIGNLVKKGLSPQIQKSLDILRITGNNAVHPGEINIDEKPELVLRLFKLINFIAEKMITEPKEVEDFYQELPDSTKKQINERDKA